VIVGAQSCPGSVQITGTLNSAPNEVYRLEFFANASCDPSGFGEGRDFLGATTSITDGAGNAGFSVAFPKTVAMGSSITATATDSTGNTSEFSACRETVDCNRRGVIRQTRH
jgi:hypothetical protein